MAGGMRAGVQAGKEDRSEEMKQRNQEEREHVDWEAKEQRESGNEETVENTRR